MQRSQGPVTVQLTDSVRRFENEGVVLDWHGRERIAHWRFKGPLVRARHGDAFQAQAHFAAGGGPFVMLADCEPLLFADAGIRAIALASFDELRDDLHYVPFNLNNVLRAMASLIIRVGNLRGTVVRDLSEAKQAIGQPSWQPLPLDALGAELTLAPRPGTRPVGPRAELHPPD